MKIMKNPYTTSILLPIAFIAAVAIIVTGLDIFASWLHNKPDDARAQSVYNYTVDAIAMHGELEGSSLIYDFKTLCDTISRESPPGSADTELAIIHQQLTAQGYKEGYNWLWPPAVELFEVQASLVLEGRLFQSCYMKLKEAWLAKNESGDEPAFIANLEEAKELFEEAISLRAKNKADLDILHANAKQLLEQ
jgi:hypothetical protein